MKKKMDQTKALDRNRGKGIEGSDGTLAEQKFGENEGIEREQWIQLFSVESRRGKRRGKRVLASTRPPGGWRLQ